MACGAFLPERFVNDDFSAVFHLQLKMAFLASDVDMRAIQLVRRISIVHEQQLAPRRRLMATLATRDTILFELPAMHVLMTSLTATIIKSKAQLAAKQPDASGLPRMACHARRCQMSARQGKSGLLMLCQRERRRRKALDRMAFFTGAAALAPEKLPRMRISVTIHAELMSKLLRKIAASMTFLAGQRRMFAAQREIGQVMIEAIARHLLPADCAVAARAVVAKSATMRIPMAGRAIIKSQSGELHERRNFFIANFCRGSFF